MTQKDEVIRLALAGHQIKTTADLLNARAAELRRIADSLDGQAEWLRKIEGEIA